MEPNKLETQFKEQLNSREIKPSEMAWDRLDAMLTVAEKPKRSNNWMYIAASFLGFVLIATVFFSQTETVIDSAKDQVVKNTIQIQKTDTSNQKNENAIKNLNAAGNQNQIVNNSIINTSSVRAKLSGQKTNQKNQNQVVNNLIINQKTNQKNQNQLNQHVVSNSKNESSKALDVTNIEVKNDVSSLASLTPKELEVTKIKVNPNDLLSQVDGELELTFREKVIKTISRNYQNAKVAFETRNQ